MIKSIKEQIEEYVLLSPVGEITEENAQTRLIESALASLVLDAAITLFERRVHRLKNLRYIPSPEESVSFPIFGPLDNLITTESMICYWTGEESYILGADLPDIGFASCTLDKHEHREPIKPRRLPHKPSPFVHWFNFQPGRMFYRVMHKSVRPVFIFEPKAIAPETDYLSPDYFEKLVQVLRGQLASEPYNGDV